VAIALVGSGVAYAAANADGFTSGSFDTTGANFIVVSLATGNNATGDFTLTDSKSNTWTALTKSAANHQQRLYYAYNATVGTGHTFSITGTDNFPSLCIAWFSGVKATDPYDGTTVVDNQGFATSVQVGALTPTVDNCLVVTGLRHANINSNASINGGFTKTTSTDNADFGHDNGSMAYLIQTTAASAHPTWTMADDRTLEATIAAFQVAGGGATATPATVALTMTQPAVTASAVSTASPAATALTLAQPAVTPSAGSTVTPATAALVLAQPAVTATGSVAVTVIESQSAALTASRSPSLVFTAQPAVGDVVIMWPSSTTTAAITLPSGWDNPLGTTTDVESDAHQICCVAHIVTQAEFDASTKTYTATNLYDATETGDVVGCFVRYVDTADLFAGANSGFNSGNATTPHVLPGLTPDATGGLLLSSVAKDATGTYTSPGGWTQLVQSNNNQGRYLGSYDTLTTASTPISDTNITPSAGDEYASISVVMKKIPASTATPAVVALTLAQPAATAGASHTATPATAALALAQDAVTATAGSTAAPAAAALVLAQPAVTATAGSTVEPAVVALTLTQPAVTAGASHTATPATAELVLTQPSVTATAGSTAEPAVVPLVLAQPAVTATGDGGNATATPAVIPLVLAQPAVTATAGSTAEPAVVPLVVAQPSVTATAGSTAEPAVVPLLLTQPAVSASGGDSGTAAPAVVPLTLAQPAVTPSAGSSVAPATVTLTLLQPAVTPSAGSATAPATVALVLTQPAVTPSAGSSASPATVALLITQPAVTTTAGSTASPATVTLVLLVPTVTASGDVVIGTRQFASHSLRRRFDHMPRVERRYAARTFIRRYDNNEASRSRHA
jgi:hypothetical protein